MSNILDHPVLVRPRRSNSGYITGVETLAEFEEYLDEMGELDEHVGDMLDHENVEWWLSYVQGQLDEFVEVDESLVERLRAAHEEYQDALDDFVDALPDEDEL